MHNSSISVTDLIDQINRPAEKAAYQAAQDSLSTSLYGSTQNFIEYIKTGLNSWPFSVWSCYLERCKTCLKSCPSSFWPLYIEHCKTDLTCSYYFIRADVHTCCFSCASAQGCT